MEFAEKQRSIFEKAWNLNFGGRGGRDTGCVFKIDLKSGIKVNIF